MGAVSEHTVGVEWGDCDPSSMAFYPHYFFWFSAATHILFHRVGMSVDVLQRRFGVLIPVVDASVRFHHPTRARQSITFRSRIESWHPKSFTVMHEGYRDGKLLVTGREVRMCCIPHPEDPERLKPVPVAQEIMDAFK